MDNLKEIRWKQRVENFDKSYKLLKKYSSRPIVTELEKMHGKLFTVEIKAHVKI